MKCHALTEFMINASQHFLLLHILLGKQANERSQQKQRAYGLSKKRMCSSWRSWKFSLQVAGKMMNYTVREINFFRAKIRGCKPGRGACFIDKDTMVRVISEGWIMAHTPEPKLFSSTLLGICILRPSLLLMHSCQCCCAHCCRPAQTHSLALPLIFLLHWKMRQSRYEQLSSANILMELEGHFVMTIFCAQRHIHSAPPWFQTLLGFWSA